MCSIEIKLLSSSRDLKTVSWKFVNFRENLAMRWVCSHVCFHVCENLKFSANLSSFSENMRHICARAERTKRYHVFVTFPVSRKPRKPSKLDIEPVQRGGWDRGGNTLQRVNTENSKNIFPEKELHAHSPNFHIHVSVSFLYIPTIDLPTLLQENMWDRSWVYINRTKDTWLWKLDLSPCNSQKRNT